MEGVQEKSSLLMLVASSEAENEPLSVQETEIQEKNTVMELQLDTILPVQSMMSILSR